MAANPNPQTDISRRKKMEIEVRDGNEKNNGEEEFAALKIVVCVLVFVSDLLRFPLGICRERKMRINRCLLFVERENRRWGEKREWGYIWKLEWRARATQAAQ